MLFATIVGLLVTALSVSAQTSDAAPSTKELLSELTQLPTCATTCVTTSLPVSQCTVGDFACLCADEAYISASETCILSACTVKEALLAQRWQKKACQAPVRHAGRLTSRVGTVMLTIACVCVALRFLSRWQIQDSTIGWDDWTILACVILLIPSTILLQIMADKAMGQDIWTVPFEDINMMFKIFWAEQYIYQVIIVLTKVSIILLYLRIFPKEISPHFTYTCWGVIVLLITYGVALLIYFALECQPISYFWKQWDGEHEGQCSNIRLATYIGSGINIFFDLVVFFLPVPRLMKLQVRDTRRKVGVVLTFLVGLFVTICSIIRLKSLAQIGQYTNATYHYNEIGLWSGLEGDVGVICACMPSIAGPILYFFRNTVASKLNSSSKSGSNSRMESRINDKSVRLHSRASDRGDVELVNREDKGLGGGIQKTTVTSLYNLPQNKSSTDDHDLVYHYDGRPKRNQWEV